VHDFLLPLVAHQSRFPCFSLSSFHSSTCAVTKKSVDPPGDLLDSNSESDLPLRRATLVFRNVGIYDTMVLSIFIVGRRAFLPPPSLLSGCDFVEGGVYSCDTDHFRCAGLMIRRRGSSLGFLASPPVDSHAFLWSLPSLSHCIFLMAGEPHVGFKRALKPPLWITVRLTPNRVLSLCIVVALPPGPAEAL